MKPDQKETPATETTPLLSGQNSVSIDVKKELAAQTQRPDNKHNIQPPSVIPKPIKEKTPFIVVHVWSKDVITQTGARKVGHVSMQLFDSDIKQFDEFGYISAWPGDEKNQGIKFIQDLFTDINVEGGIPEHSFIIHSLDVDSIRTRYKTLHAHYKTLPPDIKIWSETGSGFFKNPPKKTNCSGLVMHLLDVGGIKKMLHQEGISDICFACNTEDGGDAYRTRYIIGTASEGYSSTKGWTTCCLLLFILIVASTYLALEVFEFLPLLYHLVVGEKREAVEPNNFSLADNDIDVDDAVAGARIVRNSFNFNNTADRIAYGATFTVPFMLLVLSCPAAILLSRCRSASTWAAILPEDVEFVLTELRVEKLTPDVFEKMCLDNNQGFESRRDYKSTPTLTS